MLERRINKVVVASDLEVRVVMAGDHEVRGEDLSQINSVLQLIQATSISNQPPNVGNSGSTNAGQSNNMKQSGEGIDE